ncbi:response regulator [Pseudomaricurvus alkylphenolicus]|jgi:putative two-component system response regulator|uniref:response regulator n=1 Tax=Pseudomaricurvus alkylphenolicus TaxID=1306991 RepID=UPI0014220F6F|nr:response regulator [Pseudomaricurvus alkylphenolicus]NIB39062.1 response regulator [Pseudomaricurvus alkylphenolicus]
MNKRILIAESSQSIATLFQLRLEEAGFRVDVCRSLNDCQLLLEGSVPDLVLSAMELPDGTGVQLCEQLKRNTRTVLVPVILMSGQDSSEKADIAYSAGATDFISKSGNLTFLVERIKSALFHHSTIPFGSRHRNSHFTILLAEDSAVQRELYQELLGPLGYRLIQCEDGEEAWEQILKERDRIDLIITDLHMPHLTGEELCHLVRANANFDHIPIIVVTSRSEESLLVRLLQRGVTDYLTKPFQCEEFIARVRVHLRNRLLHKEQQFLQHELQQLNNNLELQVRRRTEELQEANISTIYKLAVACDYKDKSTAFHISRVRCYMEALARASGVAAEPAREMGYSSMMHDIGKIGVPDRILNKAGQLDGDEWRIMQSHTIKGAEILGNHPFFSVAREIALYHHEKYDGSGYPHRLKGEDIPLPARLIAVVDVFDALTSERTYKQAWDIEDALKELESLAGSHLDPKIVKTFIRLQRSGALNPIRERYPLGSEHSPQEGMQLG